MLDLLCAILRDEPFAWPDAAGDQGHLFDLARHHGVHLLVAHRAAERGRMRDCPQQLRERFLAAVRNQVAIDEIGRNELRVVLAALDAAGVAPLLFKGAALAYSHYSDPTLRPRVDTDVLVDAGDAGSIQAVLEQLGYRRLPFVSGDLVMHQLPYVRTDSRGVPHAIDVHWKISNPQVFAQVITIQELRVAATRVPLLGPSARAVGSAHALMLACIHRVAHHSNEERLIWSYDIHLIAERLAPEAQDQVAALIDAKQLTQVCAAGLCVARDNYHGPGATSLLARLNASARAERFEAYASGPMRKIDVLRSDLAALEGWRAKMKLLREHVLPPASYMRETHGVSSSALLPLFYVWRVVRGARAWFRRRS